MLYGLYVSAAGVQVNHQRQQLQANNLANVTTVGFKPDRLLVCQVEPPCGVGVPRAPASVQAVGAWVDMRAGPMDKTGQPTDLALDTGPQANGFLTVRDRQGNIRYTRDGRLTSDLDGRLVTLVGRLEVLDEACKPICLDPAAGPMHVDEARTISQAAQQVACLGLAGFDRPECMVKAGDGLFAGGLEAGPRPFDGRVVQGFLEGSAVEPAAAMAAMIETMRAYEANANMIRYQDQTLGRAVNDIARIG